MNIQIKTTLAAIASTMVLDKRPLHPSNDSNIKLKKVKIKILQELTVNLLQYQTPIGLHFFFLILQDPYLKFSADFLLSFAKLTILFIKTFLL